jgi:hypothetical protein
VDLWSGRQSLWHRRVRCVGSCDVWLWGDSLRFGTVVLLRRDSDFDWRRGFDSRDFVCQGRMVYDRCHG